MAERILTYGGETIHVELLPRPRLGTKLRLKVLSDLRVQALVPEGTPDSNLEQALQHKIRWIWQKLRDFRAVQEYTIPREYVSGESHFYLGRRYLLKVYYQPNSAETVRMSRGYLEVSVQQRHALRIRKLLDSWYFTRAQKIFQARLTALLPITLWVKKQPVMKLRVMRKQWGNCSPKGMITLNPYLVKAPRECVDYVVLHELCHLKEHNHSLIFWSLLDRVMPDWERYKARLDAMAELLLQK